jgi:hypothetical protein
VEHHGDPDDFLIQALAVAHAPVLFHLLPVVGGHDSQRAVVEPQPRELAQESGDALVGLPDLAVVEIDRVLDQLGRPPQELAHP